jgi:hypothetical protein
LRWVCTASMILCTSSMVSTSGSVFCLGIRSFRSTSQSRGTV